MSEHEKETFEQMMARINKERKSTQIINLHIKNCPADLYEDFVKDIYKYNDLYWCKIKDLMRKAEVYDYMMAGQPMPENDFNECITSEPDNNNEQQEDEPLTIGDLKRMRKENNENDK